MAAAAVAAGAGTVHGRLSTAIEHILERPNTLPLHAQPRAATREAAASGGPPFFPISPPQSTFEDRTAVSLFSLLLMARRRSAAKSLRAPRVQEARKLEGAMQGRRDALKQIKRCPRRRLVHVRAAAASQRLCRFCSLAVPSGAWPAASSVASTHQI